MRDALVGHGVPDCLVPSSAPAAWPLWCVALMLSAMAWGYLIQTRHLAPFDPGSADYLCFGLGAASPDLIWRASRGLFVEGSVMVLAMMLPAAAARAALAPAKARGGARVRSVNRLGWMASYLAVWFGAVALAVAAVALLRWWIDPQGQAALLLTRWAPVALCVAAGVQLWRRATVGAFGRAREGDDKRAAIEPCGHREGVQCLRRCALAMMALHAVGGMSLFLMAAYTALAWRFTPRRVFRARV